MARAFVCVAHFTCFVNLFPSVLSKHKHSEKNKKTLISASPSHSAKHVHSNPSATHPNFSHQQVKQPTEIQLANLQQHSDVDNPLVVDFFIPSCSHCVEFAPSFQSVATSMKEQTDAVTFVAIDCMQQQGFCDEMKIDGFPTIKMYPKDIEFMGTEVTAATNGIFANWINSNLGQNSGDAIHTGFPQMAFKSKRGQGLRHNSSLLSTRSALGTSLEILEESLTSCNRENLQDALDQVRGALGEDSAAAAVSYRDIDVQGQTVRLKTQKFGPLSTWTHSVENHDGSKFCAMMDRNTQPCRSRSAPVPKNLCQKCFCC